MIPACRRDLIDYAVAGLVQVVFVGIVLAGTVASASVGAAEYYAEVINRGPQGVLSRARLHVSGERARRESTHRGERVIQIRGVERGTEWTLFPGEHSYVETGFFDGDLEAQGPCSGLAGATCAKLGTGEISGRRVVHWEMVTSANGRHFRSQFWIDIDRGIPLRQETSDGTDTRWQLEALDRVEGRHVEKWSVSTERPGEVPVRFLRWIDPELGIPVREELPGGFVRELRNIRVGPQPEHLFSIPVGYRRVYSQLPPGIPPIE